MTSQHPTIHPDTDRAISALRAASSVLMAAALWIELRAYRRELRTQTTPTAATATASPERPAATAEQAIIDGEPDA